MGQYLVKRTIGTEEKSLHGPFEKKDLNASRKGKAMLNFTAAPAVPKDYYLLHALDDAELARAEKYGYVSDTSFPGELVNRSGIDISFEDRSSENLTDWYIRMYLIWLCYIFENFLELQNPLGAIEELVLEFRSPTLIDHGPFSLGTTYVGAGAEGPITRERAEKEKNRIKPYYNDAKALLRSLIK
jgi:hypothetical protein